MTDEGSWPRREKICESDFLESRDGRYKVPGAGGSWAESGMERKDGVAGAQGKGAEVDEVWKCPVLEAILKRADVIPKATVEQLLQAPQCWGLCRWPPYNSSWALREGGRGVS